MYLGFIHAKHYRHSYENNSPLTYPPSLIGICDDSVNKTIVMMRNKELFHYEKLIEVQVDQATDLTFGQYISKILHVYT